MNKTLSIVLFIVFINAMSVSIVVPVIYIYAKELNATEFQASLILGLFSLSQFIATPIIGRLSDYKGRRMPLIISLAGTCIANILAFIAPSILFLYGARILDGITGGNNSVAAAVISDISDQEDKAKNFSLFSAAFGAAFIVGPLLSIAAQEVSLEAPYLISACLAFFGVIITFIFLPETLELKNREKKKLTFAGLGFTQIVTALKYRGVRHILFLCFFITLVFGIFQFGYQSQLVNKFDASSKHISLLLFLFGVITVISQTYFIKPILKRFSQIEILFKTIIIRGFALIGLSIVPNFVSYVILVIPLAASGAFQKPILNTLMSNSLKKEDQGVGMGLVESYFSLATAIGPVIGGVVVNLGNDAPIILTGIISLSTAIYIYIFRKGILFNTLNSKQVNL